MKKQRYVCRRCERTFVIEILEPGEAEAEKIQPTQVVRGRIREQPPRHRVNMQRWLTTAYGDKQESALRAAMLFASLHVGRGWSRHQLI